jgi:hypothetical protein
MLKSVSICTLALSLAAAGTALALSQSAADRAEAQVLPTFEVMGMPIAPVQVQVVGSAHVRERSPTPTLVLEGMPASPHQLTVLTPRRPTTVVGAAARTQ